MSKYHEELERYYIAATNFRTLGEALSLLGNITADELLDRDVFAQMRSQLYDWHQASGDHLAKIAADVKRAAK